MRSGTPHTSKVPSVVPSASKEKKKINVQVPQPGSSVGPYQATLNVESKHTTSVLEQTILPSIMENSMTDPVLLQYQLERDQLSEFRLTNEATLNWNIQNYIDVFKKLALCKNIRVIYISGINLFSSLPDQEKIILKVFVEVLKNSQKLIELHLKNICLNDDNLIDLTHGLINCTNLNVVDLSCNLLKEEGALTLKDYLLHLNSAQLNSLNVQNNPFPITGYKELFSGVQGRKNADEFELSIGVHQLYKSGAVLVFQDTRTTTPAIFSVLQDALRSGLKLKKLDIGDIAEDKTTEEPLREIRSLSKNKIVCLLIERQDVFKQTSGNLTTELTRRMHNIWYSHSSKEDYVQFLSLLNTNKTALNELTGCGFTLLSFATLYYLQEIINHLLYLNADPNLGGKNSPLNVAIRSGYNDIVETLISKGTEVKGEKEGDTFDYSPVKSAIVADNPKALFLLFKKDPSLKQVRLEGDMPLLWGAVALRKYRVVKYLCTVAEIKSGEKYQGQTALEKANKLNDVELCNALNPPVVHVVTQNPATRMPLLLPSNATSIPIFFATPKTTDQQGVPQIIIESDSGYASEEQETIIADLENAKSKIKSHEKELSSHTKAIAGLNEKILQQETRIASQKTELEKVKGQLQQQQQEAQQRNRSSEAALKQQSAINNDLTQHILRLEEKLTQQTTLIENVIAYRVKHDSEFSDHKRHQKDQTKQLQHLQNQVHQLQKKLDEISNDVQKARLPVENLMQDNTILNAQFAKFKTDTSALLQQLAEQNDIRTEFKTHMDTQQQQISDFAKENALLKDHTANQRKEIDALKNDSSKQQQLDALKAQLSNLQQQITSIFATVELIQSQLLAGERVALINQLSGYQTLIQSIQGQLNSFNGVQNQTVAQQPVGPLPDPNFQLPQPTEFKAESKMTQPPSGNTSPLLKLEIPLVLALPMDDKTVPNGQVINQEALNEFNELPTEYLTDLQIQNYQKYVWIYNISELDHNKHRYFKTCSKEGKHISGTMSVDLSQTIYYLYYDSKLDLFCWMDQLAKYTYFVEYNPAKFVEWWHTSEKLTLRMASITIERVPTFSPETFSHPGVSEPLVSYSVEAMQPQEFYQPVSTHPAGLTQALVSVVNGDAPQLTTASAENMQNLAGDQTRMQPGF